MHPVSAHSEDPQPGGTDDEETHQVEDEFGQVSRGRYEEPPVRVARHPRNATDREVEEHNVTHLPHRSWCPVCVKARGKEEAHKKVREQGEVPTVSMDYKSFDEASTDEDKITMIVVKDETTAALQPMFANKRAQQTNGWSSECLTTLISSDTVELCSKDGEPALGQVQSATKEAGTHPTICQNPPAYNPQSNGSAERAVQEVMSQVRAMKLALDQRLGTSVKTDWKALEWMVELSAVLINRCLVGHDGKTPYSRLMVKNSSKELVEFGERVLAKITRCHTSTRKQAPMSRREDAIWVGVAKKSNEHIVVREGGGPAKMAFSKR